MISHADSWLVIEYVNVLWKEVPRMVTVQFGTYSSSKKPERIESCSLGWERKNDGIPHLKLIIISRPIANKYREGKMQSTLKRGLHAPETTVLQALGTFVFAGFTSLRLQLNLAVTVSATKANLNNASEKVLRTPCLRVKHANSCCVVGARSCQDPEDKFDCACVERFDSCSARYVQPNALAT